MHPAGKTGGNSPDNIGPSSSPGRGNRGEIPPTTGPSNAPGREIGGKFPREHWAIERSRPAGKTGENSPDDRTIGCIRPGNRGKISPTTLGHRMHPAGESGENSPENIGPSSAPGREIGGKFPRQHRAIEFTRPGNRGETPLLGAWIRGFFLALFFLWPYFINKTPPA
jgi:hypothetical protein